MRRYLMCSLKVLVTPLTLAIITQIRPPIKVGGFFFLALTMSAFLLPKTPQKTPQISWNKVKKQKILFQESKSKKPHE